MAQIAYQYCTGPVDVFVGYLDIGFSVGDNGGGGPAYGPITPIAAGAAYLGTCERYPLVQGIQNWNPVYNDINGPMEEFDSETQLRSKVLALDLNKMQQAVVDQLISIGQDDSLSNGQLLIANQLFFVTWLSFRYFGTANDVSGGTLPPGEFYYCCKIPESGYDPIGSQTRKTRVIVQAKPYYNAVSGVRNTFSQNPDFFAGLPAVG